MKRSDPSRIPDVPRKPVTAKTIAKQMEKNRNRVRRIKRIYFKLNVFIIMSQISPPPCAEDSPSEADPGMIPESFP